VEVRWSDKEEEKQQQQHKQTHHTTSSVRACCPSVSGINQKMCCSLVFVLKEKEETKQNKTKKE
jgi:hypothetical protein